MTPSQKPRCWCCRSILAGPHWQIVTPSGFTERVCRDCAPHAHLTAAGGIDFPDPCPDAAPDCGPRLRVLP